MEHQRVFHAGVQHSDTQGIIQVGHFSTQIVQVESQCVGLYGVFVEYPLVNARGVGRLGEQGVRRGIQRHGCVAWHGQSRPTIVFTAAIRNERVYFRHLHAERLLQPGTGLIGHRHPVISIR